MFSDLYGLSDSASKEEDRAAFHVELVVSSNTESKYDRSHGFFSQPIFCEIYNDSSVAVGSVIVFISWDRSFANRQGSHLRSKQHVQGRDLLLDFTSPR
jgi:hypothetical protein